MQFIFNQVLKPLDVKTKFYNAEVSVGQITPLLNELYCQGVPASRFIPHLIFIIRGVCWMPVEAVRVRKHLDLHKSQIEGGERVFSSQRQPSL